MEKIIHKLINNFTEGVDTYTHNGSTWLIFSESKQWVIELTESKTLWYNYNFFNNVFSYTSMDVVDNQHYITKWVEDNVIISGVKQTELSKRDFFPKDIIQNGVKETRLEINITEGEVDDIIQDGVKETIECNWDIPKSVINGVVNDGVRDTQSNPYENESWIEGVIKKGVRHTLNTEYIPTSMVEDIIQSGVRKTLWISVERESLVEKTINNGIKETNHVDVMKFFDNKMEDALQNGVKKTYHDTDNYTDDVKEVIREGVRTSRPRKYVGENIIDKIIDKGVIETHDDVYHHKGRIDGVIKNGVKETHREICEYKKTIDYIIKTGIKETKTPGKDGYILSTIEWMEENNSFFFTSQMIDDVLDNGEKINGTYAGGQRQSEKCKSVVEYGTKTPTD
jgi:hypothetical protein